MPDLSFSGYHCLLTESRVSTIREREAIRMSTTRSGGGDSAEAREPGAGFAWGTLVVVLVMIVAATVIGLAVMNNIKAANEQLPAVPMHTPAQAR
jgi:hypothetical protein